jgi:hypothetical protein
MVVCVCTTAAFASSFKDNGNETVTDLTTNLMWQQCSAGYSTVTTTCDTSSGTILYTWENAITYCEGLMVGGFTDWRLPNIKELKSIADMAIYNPTINVTYFPNPAASFYLSSTTEASWSGAAWTVNFASGVASSQIKANTFYVRCVRGQ